MTFFVSHKSIVLFLLTLYFIYICLSGQKKKKEKEKEKKPFVSYFLFNIGVKEVSYYWKVYNFVKAWCICCESFILNDHCNRILLVWSCLNSSVIHLAITSDCIDFCKIEKCSIFTHFGPKRSGCKIMHLCTIAMHIYTVLYGAV